MNAAANVIRDEIAVRGAVSFARFMDLALYCPVCGFYEMEGDIVGRRGDYYTSVSVGSLFGELLAFDFSEWLRDFGTSRELRAANRWHIVEAGAHDGRLAKDILNWLHSRRPALSETIEYWIIEPSAARRLGQQRTLREFGESVRWFGDLSELASASVNGVIFSNELLDAMPVHRFGWDAKGKRWFEWGVGFNEGRFVWTQLPETGTASMLPKLPPALLRVLPDGFTTEVCPAAEGWWRRAGGLLDHGKLLTFDYGLNTEEFFLPQRAQGTVRAYHRHRQCADLLANTGEQDITAHVNFGVIQAAGEAVGLKTEAFMSQTQFLTGIAQRAWREESDFGVWTKEHLRQFQTLTHPDHLGRAFRVLIQTKSNGSYH